MVDPGEMVSQTLQREFSEEALNSLKASPEERKDLQERILKLFTSPAFQVRNLEFRKKMKSSCSVLTMCSLFFFSLRCIKGT